jgi:adenylate kinase family enzyme
MARTIPQSAPITALPQRIVVSGTTGSGKSTLAREIAAIANLPYVELDALHWEPNWTEAEPQVFRERVRAALAGDRWVVDGNYSVLRDLIWPRAELLVWLDYSIVRIFWQLFRRTSRRVITREELWAGNRERFRAGFMSRESLFVWALQTHWKKRRVWPDELAKPEHARITAVRLHAPRQAATLKQQLRGLAAGQTAEVR